MKIRKILSFILVAVLAFFVIGCEFESTTSSTKVKSIEPDKSTFAEEVILNDFDIRDWEIIVTYGDDSQEVIQVTYNMLSSADIAKLLTVGEQTLTFSYEGKSFEYVVNITYPTTEELQKTMDIALNAELLPESATENFTLPSVTGSVNISWEVESDYVNIKGTKAEVTRPSAGSEDAVAKFTATFTLYDLTETKEYEVIIPAQGVDDIREYLENLAEFISVPSSVTGSLSLPFTIEGVQLKWTSSNTSQIIIDNDTQTVIVNPAVSETLVILSYVMVFDGIEYADFRDIGVNVIPEIIVSIAPCVTNLNVSNKVATWTAGAGVTKYGVYVNNRRVSETTSTSFNLASYLSNAGTYTIGIVSLSGGAYNTDSQMVTTKVTVESTNGYNGTYYNSANLTLTGSQLKANLRTLISSTHKNARTYENLKTDLAKSDVVIGNSSKVLLIYSRKQVQAKWSSGGSIWNREHVWPQSQSWFTTSGAGADAHHLRPEDPTVNSTRGNHPFGEFTGGSAVKFSSANGGGESGCYLKNGYFMPRAEAKGDVARIVFYLLTRYPESDSYKITNVAQSMDMLLKWNAEDPVDEWEMNRNDVVQSIQGNRNPFIDYPTLADDIWG